jgi:hypothetical protein
VLAVSTLQAWGHLTTVGSSLATTGQPLPGTFTYDLVDVGREVLAQLTIPVSQNFSRLLHAPTLHAEQIQTMGGLYSQVLVDLDKLLITDAAFLLGSWLESARRIGGNATDCTDTVLGDKL